ncbi:MAG: hypothetical protein ABUL42_01900 [Terricaulis silvestris]
MHRLILAHVAGDEVAAQAIGARLGEASPITMVVRLDTRPILIGSSSLLGVIWSERAASVPEYARLVEIAAAAGSAAVLFCADETPVRDAMARLGLLQLPLEAGGPELQAALRVARHKAASKSAPATWPAKPMPGSAPIADGKASYGRMFVSGMTRGLASSVAIIGLGAGAAVGVQQQALLGSTSFASPLDAHVEHVNATIDVHGSFAGHQPGLVSDAEMSRQAGALREAITAQRSEIFQTLDRAEQQLADARTRTDSVIARLQAISTTDRHFFAAASPATMRAPAPAVQASAAPIVHASATHLQTAAPALAPAAAASASPIHQAAAMQRRAIAASTVTLTPPVPQEARLELPSDLYALKRYALTIGESQAKLWIGGRDLELWSPS